MREEWLEVSVTFDERHSYVASAPELRSPVVRSLTNGLPSRPMSALGGSGRAAPKEEVRVLTRCGHKPGRNPAAQQSRPCYFFLSKNGRHQAVKRRV